MAVEGFDLLFLDSSFLIALHGVEDATHERAIALLSEADREGSRLCTIWDCVSEALTILRRHFGHRPACALADAIDDLSLVTYDTSHRLEAVDLFRRASRGRPVSYVDALCAVVVKRELRGAPALSFDSDFARLGLTVIR